MAQPMHCDGCDGAEQATLLITNLANGDVIALGPSCIPAWGQAIGAAVEATVEHDDEQAEQPGGQAPEGVTDGISPSHPATYGQPEAGDDVHPHAPAETGPGTYTEVPEHDGPGLPADHPHAPAETGPSTYGEEGGGTPTPAPPLEPGGDQPSDPASEPDTSTTPPTESLLRAI